MVKILKTVSSEYRLALLDASYAEESRKMRDEIMAELRAVNQSQAYIVDETDEEFDAFFSSSDSYPLGVLTSDGELAAVGIGSYRKNAIDALLARLSESSVPSDWRQIGYIELVQVRKEHRGHGFQRMFFNELEAIFRANKNHEVSRLMGIVSPDNEHSLANFQKCGYKIALQFTHPITGYERLIMVKELIEDQTNNVA